MKLTACVWCSSIIRVDDIYDDKTHKGVCSESCAKQERAFMIMFSDKHIGEKNMRDFGVNPNDRGKKGGNTLSDVP